MQFDLSGKMDYYMPRFFRDQVAWPPRSS